MQQIKQEDWKDKIRQDYRDIISEEQIEETIKYWEKIIEPLLSQKDQEIKDIKEKLSIAIHKIIK